MTAQKTAATEGDYEALGFLSKLFLSIQQSQSLPYTPRLCSFRRKNDYNYRCHCDLSMTAKRHVKILITDAFNFRANEECNLVELSRSAT